MSTPPDRRDFLKSTAATLAASRLGLIDAAAARSTEDELSALRGATAWLNSQPLTAASLRGKVVIVDFWTYTCVN